MCKGYLFLITICVRDIYPLLMLAGQNYTPAPPLKLKNKIHRL
jgi:hypothetical protein